MSSDQGMGSCLIQQANGLPCGRQIAEGEPVGTVISGATAIVGHKRCADSFTQRKMEDQVVKIGKQSGAGGPVDVSTFADGVMHSTPLETKPGYVAPELPPMPAGVRSIAEVPFEEQTQLGTQHPAEVDQVSSALSKHELAVIQAFRAGGSKAVAQLELKREQVKHTITIPLQDVPDETTVLEIRLVWPS